MKNWLARKFSNSAISWVQPSILNNNEKQKNTWGNGIAALGVGGAVCTVGVVTTCALGVCDCDAWERVVNGGALTFHVKLLLL